MSLRLVKTRLPGYHVVERPDHECCICGKVGKWDKNWSWYGSFLDMDNGKELGKCCSKPCRDAYSKKHRIPYMKRT